MFYSVLQYNDTFNLPNKKITASTISMTEHIANRLLITNKLLQLYKDGSENTEVVIEECALIGSFIKEYKANGLDEKKFFEFACKFMESEVINTNILQFCNFPFFIYKKIMDECRGFGEYAYQLANMIFKKSCYITYGLEQFSNKKQHKKHKLKIYRVLYSKFKDIDFKFGNLSMENIYNEYKKLFIQDSKGSKYVKKILASKKSRKSTSINNVLPSTNGSSTNSKESSASANSNAPDSSRSLEKTTSSSESSSDDDSEMDNYRVSETVDLEAFESNGNLRAGFFDISQFENDFDDEVPPSPTGMQNNLPDNAIALVSPGQNSNTIDDMDDAMDYQTISTPTLDSYSNDACKIDIDNTSNLSISERYDSNDFQIYQDYQFNGNDTQTDMEESPQRSRCSDISLCSIFKYATWDEDLTKVGNDYNKGLEGNFDDSEELKEDNILNNTNFNEKGKSPIQLFNYPFPDNNVDNSPQGTGILKFDSESFCDNILVKHQNTDMFPCHKCGIMHSPADSCFIDE